MLESKVSTLTVTSVRCPEFPDEYVYEVTMMNDQVIVHLTNFGAAITGIELADRNGIRQNIVAGFKQISEYQSNTHYFGCILGRYAGRISEARFRLDNKQFNLSKNDGPHHLHGGNEGFNKKIWVIKTIVQESDHVGIIMEYLSLDGEEGYPGNLWTQVKYTLDNNNALSIEYNANTDQLTPLSLSNHSYFNLSGFKNKNILNHQLEIKADRYTAKTADHVPTGEICGVGDTPLDFTRPQIIGDTIESFPVDGGLNHNFILNNFEDGQVKQAVKLNDPASGRYLIVYTDQPCVQIYTANDWRGLFKGTQNVPYNQHGAIAIETQAFPDAPNHAAFPAAYLRPGENYKSKTIYAFGFE